jgi:hypothetical protein
MPPTHSVSFSWSIDDRVVSFQFPPIVRVQCFELGSVLVGYRAFKQEPPAIGTPDGFRTVLAVVAG